MPCRPTCARKAENFAADHLDQNSFVSGPPSLAEGGLFVGLVGRNVGVLSRRPLRRHLSQDERQIFNDIGRILNVQPNIFEMRLLVLSLISTLLTATAFGQYNLVIEQSAPVGAYSPGTVYRFYIEANDPTDKLSAVIGNDEDNLFINTPEGIYNNAFNSSWNASGINPALLPVFPDLADDSYATIGLSGPAAGVPGAEDPSLVQDAYLSPTVSDYFLTGGTELNVNTLTGASWYVLATAANALPTDGRWLVAQITTAGDLSGTLNAQMFPLGVGANQIQQSWDFAGGEVIIPCDGELDECGVCNGPGVA